MTSASKSTQVTPKTARSQSRAKIRRSCRSIKLRFNPLSVGGLTTVKSKSSYSLPSPRPTRSSTEETWMIQRWWGKESRRCRTKLVSFKLSSRTWSPQKIRGPSQRNSANNQVPRRQLSPKRLAKPKLTSRGQSATSEVEPEPAILFHI